MGAFSYAGNVKRNGKGGRLMNKDATENVTYCKVQRFRQTWIWLLIALLVGIAWYGFLQQIVLGKPFGGNPALDLMMWIFWIVFGVGLPLLFYSVKLIVEVKEDGIHIRFFPLHSRGKGWAYNVSGNRGVQLELADGKQLLIGSQNPEKLAQMIGKAMNQ
jgi:hypothetical protein